MLDEILDEACEGDDGLVVIGAHATGGWWMRWMVQAMGGEILPWLKLKVPVLRTPGSRRLRPHPRPRW